MARVPLVAQRCARRVYDVRTVACTLDGRRPASTSRLPLNFPALLAGR